MLLAARSALLRGRRLALLAHQASVNADLEHAASLLRDAPRARLVRLFAPEHGLWGAAQDHATITRARDPVTGLPVLSLYGRRRAPTRSMLRGLDALIVDLQDVGARYYTFVWTMALAMGACGRAGVPVIVLDRPNPLGGEAVEGNLPDPEFASFVGLYPLPARHGMTIGELATYLNRRYRLGCALTVVPMQGWRRGMLWEDTGLPWVAPSPNMATPDTARVYPGGCLIEGTNLSEGRGTTRPFEWVGAPYPGPSPLRERAEEAAVTRRPVPPDQVQANVSQVGGSPLRWCANPRGGSQAVQALPDRPGPAGVARQQAPRRFAWRRPPYEFESKRLPIDILLGTDVIRRGLERGATLAMLERAGGAGSRTG